jgi:predicted O-linked N-acetylglucosamine transferase (SPINDLY family)
MAPTPQQLFEQAMQQHRAGRMAEAEALYRNILSRQPNHADACQMLGILANQTGRSDEAGQLLRQAIELNPGVASYHNNLGLTLVSSGRPSEAIAVFTRALQIQPDFPEAQNNLGTALRACGQIKDAIAAYQRAVAIRPEYPEALNNLAGAVRADGRLEEAIEIYRKAIALRPNYVEAWDNLGHALRTNKQFDEAIAAYRHVLTLRPNAAGTLTTLGDTLKDVGLLDEAIDCYRKSLSINPDSRTGENLLYTLHYQTDDPALLWQEHLHWNQAFALPLAPVAPAYANDPNPDRRLRIGYVSPDFRAHCQALFTVPLFSHHDRSQFEIFCYANVEQPDTTTAQIKPYADQWRDIVKLTDQHAADLIRADRIDILADLTLHMGHSRPLVFARKPAPVQVTWLGYPSTTGLTAIDYRLSDPHLDPSTDDERFYSEKTVRLPETFWCYDPLITGLPVNDLPALKDGRVTFGCLNNFCKITEGTLDLWAKVLASTTSRLIVLAPPGASRDRISGGLSRRGIEPGRIEFIEFQPREKYLALYHQIDVCLDTIPYPGHTTTIDAIWMGVPVVNLPGRTSVARGGISILRNVGLGELIARDADDYVRITRSLVSDLPRLAALRSSLRTRIQQSPIMNAPRFAQNIEAAFREMWRRWCSSPSPEGRGGKSTPLTC